MPKGKGALYYAIARPVGMQVVGCALGDCHSRAVASFLPVTHAGGVKIYAFPLHAYLWPF